jgi:hypothetical protein
MASSDELVAELIRSGYHFYRLGIHSMNAVHQSGPYTAVLDTLKQALDPAGILAPGRYHRPATDSAIESDATTPTRGSSAA